MAPEMVDEKHGRDCGADRRVSRQVEPGRQDRDGYPCAASADEANQESDQKGNRGKLADDQEIVRPQAHRVRGSAQPRERQRAVSMALTGPT